MVIAQGLEALRGESARRSECATGHLDKSGHVHGASHGAGVITELSAGPTSVLRP